MNEEKQQCWNCTRYKAFYTRGNGHFNKKDVGLCQNSKKIVNENEHCEEWLNGIVSVRYRNYAISQQLAEITNRLIAIENIIKGELNLNEIK